MEKPSASTPRISVSMGKKILQPVILLALVLSLVGNGFMFMKIRSLSADPQIAAKEEAAKLVEEVGSLMVLPKDEVPTIATVTDPEQLKSQTFFANAQKGFKVLLYATAKKAILYDPIAKKIIEVAPINIGTPTDTEADTTKPITPVTP